MHAVRRCRLIAAEVLDLTSVTYRFPEAVTSALRDT